MNGSTFDVELPSLKPNTTYKVLVSAEYLTNSSLPTPDVSFTTLEDPKKSCKWVKSAVVVSLIVLKGVVVWCWQLGKHCWLGHLKVVNLILRWVFFSSNFESWYNVTILPQN